MYEVDGDPTILVEHYDAMRSWVDHMARVEGDDHGWGRNFQFGDWLALDSHDPQGRRGATDEGFIGYLSFWNSAMIVAATARVLGRDEDEQRYRELAAQLRAWIEANYYTATGRCAVNTQTAYVLSLWYGFGDAEWSSAQLRKLLEENGGKLTTGFVGTPLLCPVLTQAGHLRDAYNLLLTEDYPGWLFAVKLGATTIWERWNSLDEEGRITGTDMNSMNHYSYGSVCEWLWRWAAGLTPAEPGFRRARVAPKPGWRLGCLDARLASAAGGWRVAWKILDERHLRVEVEVPFGATAEVELPLASDVAYDELGGRVLAAGAYAVEYETTEPLRRVPSADWTLARLMGSPDTYRTLLRYVRHPEAVPAGEAAAKTVRELAARMGLDDGRLAALDADLGALAE
jgi:alpha-L-rhamnosidase